MFDDSQVNVSFDDFIKNSGYTNKELSVRNKIEIQLTES